MENQALLGSLSQHHRLLMVKTISSKDSSPHSFYVFQPCLTLASCSGRSLSSQWMNPSTKQHVFSGILYPFFKSEPIFFLTSLGNLLSDLS